MSNPAVSIPFDNSYLRVSPALYSKQLPTPVKKPALICVNEPLAKQLGINPEELQSSDGIDVMAGNQVPTGADPVATVYAGHQFGSWNPQLGDGRAILLGEVVGSDGQRYDIQLKGAGVTPYSRRGDGRSPLGPVLREYLVSEAMAAMGVATTRSLGAVTTGEEVIRDTLLPGAILTRVAKSHIRVGTFQYFSVHKDLDTLKQLADHVIERHYPSAAEAQDPYLAMFEQVLSAQAQLIAHWQSLGFIHGVMNTDNMLISGETVDYGPCAFMEEYHPGTVFSSIDHNGRYAYSNQPPVGHWNLACLAQALLPLFQDGEVAAIKKAENALESFKQQYEQAFAERMVAKIGLTDTDKTSIELVTELMDLMHKEQVDFTLGFRVLADYLSEDNAELKQDHALPAAFEPWLIAWRQQLNVDQLPAGEIDKLIQQLRSVNPVFIPRNHQVERAIAAGNQGDFTPFQQLLGLVTRPFNYDPACADYALPATAEQRVLRTFCGT